MPRQFPIRAKVAISFAYFLSLALFSLFLVIAESIPLSAVFQILFFLIIVNSFIIRISTVKLPQKNRVFLYFLGISPAALLVYIIVFSTGGLSSPFLVLTHLFAAGLAFLISPQISISFIAATLVLILSSLYFDPTAREYLQTSPLASALAFIAYLALAPFSYVLARQYKFKEDWARVLEKEIAASKSEEEALIKNINEPVFVLDKDFNLVYMNETAQTFSKLPKQVQGQDFFKLFTLKDKKGRTLAPLNLPFEQTLNKKMPYFVENLLIANKSLDFTIVDIKILPVVSRQSEGLILVIKQKSQKSEEETSYFALGRFLLFLDSQKRLFESFTKNPALRQTSQKLINRNRLLENLAQDFFYTLKLESGEIGALASIFDASIAVQDQILEAKSLAQEKSVYLLTKTVNDDQNLKIAPKNSLRIPKGKNAFEPVYILGSIPWFKDSLKRIFEILILLTPKNQKIIVNVTRTQGLAEISILAPVPITEVGAPELFEKFYGKLKDMPELSETSGLEGYIAKQLIERMGGAISVEKAENSLNFLLTFGIKEAKPSV